MATFSGWTPIHNQFHKTLLHRNLLPKNKRLLVAVSGGQDSLCLIKLLIDLQSKWGWNLAIIHCDHRWRTDSQANANYVENLANTWEIPYYQKTADVISKTEADARKWRYEVLGEIAINYNFNYVVTGHTASDRAETLLYNLIRGSGSDGLGSLPWQRPLFETGDIKGESPISNLLLVRPLLEITRSQTLAFCHEQNLTIWEDSTNKDLHYNRNRIRAEIIPLLRQFNPQVEINISQTAELLKDEIDYLEQTAQEWRNKVLFVPVTDTENQPEKTWGINRHLLREAPLAIQRRVMRQILMEILPSKPNFEHIEKMINLLRAPNRSQTDPFPGGVIAQVENPWIWIKREN
jgi:tRNA(Ile)-lysidine synthase